MAENRAYLVLARRERADPGGGGDAFYDVPREVTAASPEDAIRLAYGDSATATAYAVVSARNWVEIPVERRVQTTLKIGGREFVVNDKPESEEDR